MPDLCQLDAVKEWMKISPSVTSADARLSRLISAVSADFLSEIDRSDFYPAKSYTDIRTSNDAVLLNPVRQFPGTTRSYKLALRHVPVTAITSVTIDGVVFAHSADGIQTGWWLDADQDAESADSVRLISPTFTGQDTWLSASGAPSSIVVVYSAGYATVPPDVEQAVIEWVAFRDTMKDALGKSSAHLGSGESVQYTSLELPPATKMAIARYKAKTSLL